MTVAGERAAAARGWGRRRTAFLLAVAVVAAISLVVGLRLLHRGADGTPSEAEAAAIFRALHAGIYAAFTAGSDSAIYDALAESVDGAVLDHVYREIHAGLADREQGSGLGRILWIQVTAADAVEIAPDGFTVDASWLVRSEVTHAGHTHARLDAYRGIYEVGRVGDGWKIVDDRILSQKRLAGAAEDGEAAP